VEVHCAAFNASLLESELFGHTRGAFTGASDRKEGHLGRSEGGTLFLDEIGEVPEATQVKLLRFLQDKSFHPVGSTALRKVDVRVVAATNRPLSEAVREGRFREDLYYRLNVFSLEVPPLRERREDILPLAERYLAARGAGPERLSPGAKEKLVSHQWPGNVRELENALERALILAGEEPIPADLLLLEKPPRASTQSVEDVLKEDFDLDAFELELIQAAVRKAGGNKTAAARLLGITRRRLYSRLESLGQGGS
jgi:transcriptional regulator with PAS, ATPase and Fis domain